MLLIRFFEDVPYSRPPDATAGLQRLQKIDQILHLLGGEIYLKALVVEVDDLRQIGGGAIVKVRSACGEPRRISPLPRPISLHCPVIRAFPGSVV